MDEQNMAVNTAITPEQTTAPQEQPTITTDSQAPEKLYTSDQVVEFMRKRVERSHQSFFDRYGVNNLKGLDALFDKTKQYDQMNSAYSDIMLKNAELTQMNAFLRNNINPDRYDDIKAYFKGTEQDFTEEALLQAITSHPEWLKQEPLQAETAPKTTLRTLGVEAHNNSGLETEDMKMARVFGIK